MNMIVRTVGRNWYKWQNLQNLQLKKKSEKSEKLDVLRNFELYKICLISNYNHLVVILLKIIVETWFHCKHILNTIIIFQKVKKI